MVKSQTAIVNANLVGQEIVVLWNQPAQLALEGFHAKMMVMWLVNPQIAFASVNQDSKDKIVRI